jgi:hypothetical protein
VRRPVLGRLAWRIWTSGICGRSTRVDGLLRSHEIDGSRTWTPWTAAVVTVTLQATASVSKPVSTDLVDHDLFPTTSVTALSRRVTVCPHRPAVAWTVKRMHHAQWWHQPGVGQYVDRPPLGIVEDDPRWRTSQEEGHDAVSTARTTHTATVTVDEQWIALGSGANGWMIGTDRRL